MELVRVGLTGLVGLGRGLTAFIGIDGLFGFIGSGKEEEEELLLSAVLLACNDVFSGLVCLCWGRTTAMVCGF